MNIKTITHKGVEYPFRIIQVRSKEYGGGITNVSFGTEDLSDILDWSNPRSPDWALNLKFYNWVDKHSLLNLPDQELFEISDEDKDLEEIVTDSDFPVVFPI